MKTINDLIRYCESNNLWTVSLGEIKSFAKESLGEDDLTKQAVDLLAEIMATHKRTFTPLEDKLIETGVLSGRCYVCWHENKYYPGATVDNLKRMGFEAFYEAYKRNWEEIKNFRKKLILEKNSRSDDYIPEWVND